MAMDEWLANRGEAFFRIYSWNPPAFSIGRFQNPAQFLKPATCANDGISIVRRITGGGAIYHDFELTYSLCCPESIFSGLPVKETYRLLTAFLIQAYRKLGLNACYAAEYRPDENLGRKTELCFAGKEIYDILIDGRKIGGNAQRRSRETIFQHGSIPFRVDALKVAKYLAAPIRNPFGDAVGLFELGIDANVELLTELFAKTFADSTGWNLINSELTVEETDAIRQRSIDNREKESNAQTGMA